MNKHYIILLTILLFSGRMVTAQDLTFQELLKLRSQSFEEINEYLGNKYWRFISVEEDIWETKNITWAFGKADTKAIAWMKLSIYTYKPSSLLYQTSNTITVNNVKKKLVELGYKKKKSTIHEERIITVYMNKNYTISLTSIPEKEYENSKYIIEIEKNPPPPKPPTAAEREQRRKDSLSAMEALNIYEEIESEIKPIESKEDEIETSKQNIPEKYDCIGKSDYSHLKLYEKPDRSSKQIGENSFSPLSDRFYILERKINVEGCACWDYVYVNGYYGYTLSSWIICN